MAIFQADLILYSALNVALADMRRNTFVLDEAYGCVTQDPFLKDAYGQKEVERLKATLKKELHIFMGHRPVDMMKFPCYVIKIGGGQEDAAKDALGDSFQSEIVDATTLGGAFNETPNISGPITPINYDQLSGQLTFDEATNLDILNVYEGHYVYDSINNNYYDIKLVTSSATLLIEAGSLPNLTNMYITRKKNSIGHTKRSIWAYETHTIDIYATDATEVIYMWTILMYLLGRYKKQLLDARGFSVSTLGYSEIYKVNEEDPNNLFGRSVTIKGRVEHTWIESSAPVLEGLGFDLKIIDMQTAPAVQNQVNAQGLETISDPDIPKITD